ncbi:MAG TPA: type II toxin-antitoxin system HicB family antitoxin [Xanthobacteraceae bacterium]|jgi:predicted RNase H-like HicB family nuclease
MRYYVALIHQDLDSDFGVSFPDFPGCISAGRTLDEVRDMAVEALALHLKGLAEDGEAVPQPFLQAIEDPRSSGRWRHLRSVVVPTHIGIHASENHGMHAHPLALQE